MKSIDLFAGAGGMTTGAEQGGMRVVWAANHWDRAVQIHKLNHPACVTVQQDLQQANFGAVLGDASVDCIDAIFAGPSCQGHSSAGQVAQTERARIKHDIDRATAFAVVTACEVLAPRWVVVENVPRWLTWKLFAGWLALLHTLGYATEQLTLCADDYGAPQARERLFVLGTLNGPAALASAVAGIRARVVPPTSRRTVADFAELDRGEWKPAEACGDRAGLLGGRNGESSRDRLVAGLALGVDAWWGQHVTGHHGRKLDTPLSTLTGAGQHVLCRRSSRSKLGVEYRPLLTSEMLAAQGFPRDYKLPEDISRGEVCRAVGNAVAVPVARAIAESIMEASA